MASQRDKLADDGHLSYSQLAQFCSCPRKYYYSRVAQIPARPAYALTSGKAVHAGMEQHHIDLLRGSDTGPKDIIEIGAEHIKACPEGDDLEIPRDRAVDLFVREATPPVKFYVEKEEPKVLESDIMGIEEEVRFTIGGAEFLGYIDLHTSTGVYDFKFASRMKSEKEVAVDPQLVLYKQQLGLTEAGIICLPRERAKAVVVMQPNNEAITAGVLDWAASIVEAIQQAKSTGVWPRTDPRNWVCGATCPFHFHCFKKEN